MMASLRAINPGRDFWLKNIGPYDQIVQTVNRTSNMTLRSCPGEIARLVGIFLSLVHTLLR